MSTPPDKPLRLGGMALRNGLLVHGPTSWAAAVRDADGAIRVASGRKPRMPRTIDRMPLARGVARMAEALLLLPLVRGRLPQARLPFEDGRVAISMALTGAAGAALRRSGMSPARAEAIVAFAGVIPSAIALRDRHLAAYHGAEHKTIGAYETGGDAGSTAKEHERCGSHLVGPLALAAAAAQALAAQAPERHRRSARMAGSLAAMGIAVEVFAWMDRNRGRGHARVLQAPGMALQRFASTREPDDEQLAVADAALEALLAAETRP